MFSFSSFFVDLSLRRKEIVLYIFVDISLNLLSSLPCSLLSLLLCFHFRNSKIWTGRMGAEGMKRYSSAWDANILCLTQAFLAYAGQCCLRRRTVVRGTSILTSTTKQHTQRYSVCIFGFTYNFLNECMLGKTSSSLSHLCTPWMGWGCICVCMYTHETNCVAYCLAIA